LNHVYNHEKKQLSRSKKFLKTIDDYFEISKIQVQYEPKFFWNNNIFSTSYIIVVNSIQIQGFGEFRSRAPTLILLTIFNEF
jgi:hypothetical protein